MIIEFEEIPNFFSEDKKKVDHIKKKTGEEQAKEKGLTHFGMGRFGDGKNITHILHKGNLIQVHNPIKVTDKTDYNGKRRVSLDVQETHPLENVKPEKEIKNLEKMLRDHNKNVAQTMDKEALDSVGHYISGKLDNALSTIKRGQNPRDGDISRKLDKFDAALKHTKTPVPLTIFRPTNMDHFQKGKKFKFSSYLSGSLDPKEVESHGKHLLQIEIPKGHPGMLNDRKKGKEYVLPRNSHIHIVSDPVATHVPDFDKSGKVTSPRLLWKALLSAK